VFRNDPRARSKFAQVSGRPRPEQGAVAAALGTLGGLVGSGAAVWAYIDITSPELGSFCHPSHGSNLVPALILAFLGGLAVAGLVPFTLGNQVRLLGILLLGTLLVGAALVLVAYDSATYVGLCPESFVLRAHVGYLYVLWGVALAALLLGTGSAYLELRARPKRP
jgi:hypothetical protein